MMNSEWRIFSRNPCDPLPTLEEMFAVLNEQGAKSKPMIQWEIFRATERTVFQSLDLFTDDELIAELGRRSAQRGKTRLSKGE